MTLGAGRAISFVVALTGLLSAGCVETTITARQSNAAVLFGPVSCIGCQAKPMPSSSGDPDDVAPGTVVDVASEERAAASGGGITRTDHNTHFSLLDVLADTAIADPCHGQLRITRIDATDRAAFLLVGATSKVALRLEAVPVRVPGGSCGPRPWPYSGPDGIVTFDGEAP